MTEDLSYYHEWELQGWREVFRDKDEDGQPVLAVIAGPAGNPVAYLYKSAHPLLCPFETTSHIYKLVAR
jgi:hypothetical protein